MDLTALDLILIFFSAFGLTYGLVSGYRAGVVANTADIQMAQVQGQPEPAAVVESYYGEHSGFKGPFNLYQLYRKVLDNERMPHFVRDGATCRVCLSMWTATWFTLLALPGWPLLDFALIVFAIHGMMVMLFGLVRASRGIAPNDW